MSVVIVVPVYRSIPSETERISLQRCSHVIGRYPMVLVAPNSLDLCAYNDLLGDVDRVLLPNDYFQSVRQYSRLLCGKDFYRQFLKWDYMLIHQPDCYIFRDELEYWCGRDYDFIGPPWVSFDWLAQSRSLLARIPFIEHALNRVGNGGFSLRKVSSFYELADKIGWLGRIAGVNEDLVWSNMPRYLFQRFNIADLATALRFGFDSLPERCYEMTEHHLPFGCHGWNKQGREFWAKIIV